MAKEIVRSLTTVYADQGAEGVVRNAREIKRSLQEVADGYRQMQKEEGKAPAATKAVQRAYQDLQNDLSGSSRAMKIYQRDVETLRKAVSSGLGANTWKRDLQQIQQAFQNIGAPKGQQIASIDFEWMTKLAKKSARESAAVWEASYARLEQRTAEAAKRMSDEFRFDQIGRSAKEAFSVFDDVIANADRQAREFGERTRAAFRFGEIGKSAEESFAVFEREAQRAQGEADAFARSIAKIQAELDPLAGAQQRLNSELREYGELEAKATNEAERGALAQAKLAAQLRYRSSVQNAGAPTMSGNRSFAIDSSFNKPLSSKSARDSAQAFQEAWKEAEQFERRLAQVKQEIDPLAAAQDALNAKLAEYAQLRANGNISDQQLAQGQALAQKQFEYTKHSAEGLFDTTKLGTQDLQNLQYQLNDIGVSLASGQNPFTVMLQQGAQIGQMFGEGSTVSSAFKSVGAGIVSFVTNPINLAILGVAALAGSFALIYSAFKSDVKPISDALDKQKAAVSDLAAGYDNMAEAIERASRASIGLETFNARNSSENLGRSAQKSLREAFAPGFFDAIKGNQIFGGRIGGEGRAAVQVAEQFKAFEAPLKEFLDGLSRGEADAVKFQDAVSDIANQDKANAALQKSASRLLEMSDAGAEAQRQIEALKKSLDQMKAIDLEETFDKAFSGLREFVPDTRTDATRIRELANTARDATRSRTEKLKIDIQEKAALEELTRIETVRREGYALDVREISARTAEQKASIAAERERLSLSGTNVEQADVERRVQEAYTKSLTESQYAWDEATRQRAQSRAESIDGMKVEMAGLSQTAAGAAELTYRYEQLSAAKQAAIEQGRIVSAEEIAAIESAAAEVGYLTDQIDAATKAKERAKAVRDAFEDLRFDRTLIGLTDGEKDVREFVKRVGVEFESENGRRLAAEYRYNEALKKTQDNLEEVKNVGRDAFEDIIDAISSGEGVLDSFVGALAEVGKAFAKIGMDKAWKWLTGEKTGEAFVTGGGTDEVIPAIAGLSKSVDKLSTAITTPTVDTSYGPQLPRRSNYTVDAFGPPTASAGLSSGAAATATGNSVPVRMWNFFAGKGLQSHQIAAILGNAKAESSFNPTAVGDSGQAFGLFQHNDRKNALFNFIGGKGNLSNDMAQYEFVWKEFQTSEKKAYERLMKATDYIQANEAMISFERPSGYQNGVKNAHNYSGRLANTREAYEKYGNGKVSAISNVSAQEEIRNQTKAVSAGVVDANQRMASGAVPGIEKIDPWNNGGVDYRSKPAAGSTTAAKPSAESAGKGTGLFSRDALNVFGAGLGAFSSGYQNGSPLSGGIGGIFTGLGASQSIASAFPSLAGIAGPLGAVGGAALGILGGILGARKQREQAHRDKAAKWEELRPQYEAFDKSLSGDGNGQLRQWITSQKSQLDQYMKVGGDAWKYGSGNSTAQFASTGTKMYQKFMDMMGEYREGFTDMIEDLTSGEGLGGAFAKGRAATKDLSKQIKDMIDDVSIAFKSEDIGVPTSAAWDAEAKDWEERRNDAIAQAKKAAGEYSLSLLYTAKSTTDVEKSLDGFRGTAAGLQKILTDLGWTADQAAKDIDERLKQAISKMGETFTDGFQRDINELSDLGYENSISDAIKQRDTGIADAGRLGVDPSIVTKWFDLALKNIVENADLTSDALNKLKERFPQLADVVLDAADEISAAKDVMRSVFDQTESNLRSAYENTRTRLEGFSKSINDFLSDIKLDSGLSDLSAGDRVTAAQKKFAETLQKANAGDETAQSELTNVSREYLDAAKAYYVTSDGYFKAFDEVSASLKSADVKAVAELDLVKQQVGSLIRLETTAIDIKTAIQDFLKASQTVNENRNWGDPGFEARNKAIVGELGKMGLSYSGDFGGGKFTSFIASQLPSVQTQLNDLVDRMDRQFRLNLYDPKNKDVAGYKGYQDGGLVTNGIWNQDSVFAKLAGGEHITTARGVNARTMPTLDYINRFHDVPQPAARAVSSDSNQERAARAYEEMTRKLDILIVTTGGGLAKNVDATERGNQAAMQMALEARRASSNGKN